MLLSPRAVRPLGSRQRGLHPDYRLPGHWSRVVCRDPFMRVPVLLAAPNRSGLQRPFPAWPIRCSAFRPGAPRLASPTASLLRPSAHSLCVRSGRLAVSSVPNSGTTETASPGKLDRCPRTPAGSTAWPSMDLDFASCRPLVRPRMPRIRFLFVKTAASLHTSFRRHLAMIALVLYSPFTSIRLDRTFSPQQSQHAGHTTNPLSREFAAARVVPWVLRANHLKSF